MKKYIFIGAVAIAYWMGKSGAVSPQTAVTAVTNIPSVLTTQAEQLVQAAAGR